MTRWEAFDFWGADVSESRQAMSAITRDGSALVISNVTEQYSRPTRDPVTGTVYITLDCDLDGRPLEAREHLTTAFERKLPVFAVATDSSGDFWPVEHYGRGRVIEWDGNNYSIRWDKP